MLCTERHTVFFQSSVLLFKGMFGAARLFLAHTP